MMRSTLRGLAVATLAAGLVGLLRQRAESAQVRSGRLTPPSAETDLAPRTTPGSLAGRLARWVPAPPATPAARFGSMLWAGPLTLVGWLLALASGTRPVWSKEHRCWIAEGVGGASALALRVVGADANAIGHVVLCRLDAAPPHLLTHELVHVRQAERFGPLLFPLYVWLGARYGYRDHPLERAARLGARQAR